MMVRCAVVGNPVAHSLSPVIHQLFARQAMILLAYDKIRGDDAHFESQIGDFFDSGGLGLNITLPFKTRAFAMATVVSERCLQAKAANTLWRHDGQLYADNTDGIGLIRDMARHVDLHNKTILLLGAGGAARGIIGPLLSAGVAKLSVVNRTIAKTVDLLSDFPEINCLAMDALHAPFDVLINATSASLADNQLQLPAFIWNNQPFCYDLAYRLDEHTPFVNHALQQGCAAVDGLGMLVEQAAEAFGIWHGFIPETKSVLHALRKPVTS